MSRRTPARYARHQKLLLPDIWTAYLFYSFSAFALFVIVVSGASIISYRIASMHAPFLVPEAYRLWGPCKPRVLRIEEEKRNSGNKCCQAQNAVGPFQAI